MNWKGLAIFALLACLAQWPSTAAGQDSGRATPAAGQTATHPAVPRPAGTAQAPASRPAATPATGPATSATPPDCDSGPCDYQPAHITVATPAPAPSPWPWQDRIAWVANIVLVILGYAAIALAISLLKKIDRQTHYAETTAQAALEAAQAAARAVQAAIGAGQAVLAQAEATARAERPWVLVTVEHSRSLENGFMVVATNRGRSPARIVSAVDKTTFEADQTKLPEEPDYSNAKPNAALASVILLPGESTGIKPFSRGDVKALCVTSEKLKKVENWDEVILLYGKIAYQELIGEGEGPLHETNWCAWYIHGRQNSGMVMAGSPAYNRHT